MDTQLHPIFNNMPEPENDAVLWRYMSISQLVSLLESKRLHFTRLDQYTDHFEGIWPKKDLEYWNNLNGFNVPGHTEFLKRNKIVASCWCKSEYESAGLWRLYTKNNEGIAITTTFGKLKRQLLNFNKDSAIDLVGIGAVQYIDHVNEGLIEKLRPNEKLPNTLIPFMLKNHSYEHEKEVRALIVSNNKFEISPSGIELPADLQFIDKVYANPFCEEWYLKALASLLTRYNLSDRLQQSSLSKKSFYATIIEKGSED